jgi:D-glycero-beta-D-manno-heptose-7-phosphate kinase
MELKSIFSQFGTKKIVVVGDIMLDAYMIGHVSRISPEAPVPIVS